MSDNWAEPTSGRQMWQQSLSQEPEPAKNRPGPLLIIGVGAMVLGIALVGVVWLTGKGSANTPQAITSPAPSASASAASASASALVVSAEASEPAVSPKASVSPGADEELPSETSASGEEDSSDSEFASQDIPQQIGDYEADASMGILMYRKPTDVVGVTLMTVGDLEPSLLAFNFTERISILDGAGVCGTFGEQKQCHVKHAKYETITVGTVNHDIEVADVMMIAEAFVQHSAATQ